MKWFNLKKLNQYGFDHVFMAVAFVVLVGVVGSAFIMLNHAQGTTVAYHLEGGSYCLNDEGGLAKSGAYVVIWSCNGNPTADQWIRGYNGDGNMIESATGNVCLDDWGQSKTSGGNNWVRLYTCNTSDPAQQWYAVGSNEFQSKASGLCLDDWQAKGGNGNEVDQYKCKGGVSNQSWDPVVVSTSSSGGGSSGGSGGGSTGGSGSTLGSKIYSEALAFSGDWYAWGGGHQSYADFWQSCPNPSAGSASRQADAKSSCFVDCSGLVTQVIDKVTGQNYQWSAGDDVLYAQNTASEGKWTPISLSQVQHGDILVTDGHVEFYDSGSGSDGNWSNINSWGALETGTRVGEHSASWWGSMQAYRFE